MKPLTRKEMLLDGVAKGNLDTFKPATREEVFAKRASANAGGSGGLFIINAEMATDGEQTSDNEIRPSVWFTSEQNTFTVDKTYADVETAIANGLLPVVSVRKPTGFDDGYAYFVAFLRNALVNNGGTEGRTFFTFTNGYYNEGAVTSVTVTLQKDGRCTASLDALLLDALLG